MTTTATKYKLSGWDLSELLSEPTETEISVWLISRKKSARLKGCAAGRKAQRWPWTSCWWPWRVMNRSTARAGRLATMGCSGLRHAVHAAVTFQNRMQQVMTSIQNRLLFFDLWLESLDDATAARLLPYAATAPDFAFFLEDLRRTRPFTLDEKSEQIINLKDADGVSALMTLYTMLTNRLEFKLTVDGEERTLCDALMGYVHSPDPALRAAAYQELYRVYAGEAKILAQIYNNRVRDWHNEQVQMRGYASPLAVRNVANDVPDAAVEALLTVAQRNAPVFQRYFRLKAQWLGMEKLRRYDLYVPLAASDRTVDYPPWRSSLSSTLSAASTRALLRGDSVCLRRAAYSQRGAQGEVGRRLLRYRAPRRDALRAAQLHGQSA